MAYTRKTEDCFIIWYQYPGQPKEEIEEVRPADGGRKYATYLLNEYRLAYRGQAGSVWMSSKRLPKEPEQGPSKIVDYPAWRLRNHHPEAEIVPSTREAYREKELKWSGAPILLYGYPVGLNGTTPSGEGWYAHGRMQIRILDKPTEEGVIGWAV